MSAILELTDVVKHFPVRKFLLKAKKHVHAVDGVSLAIEPGDTFGLVGESGCGKTTLGKCIVGLHAITSGSIRFDGEEVAHLTEQQFRPYRSRISMVFQDPGNSLNPRLRVRSLLAEPVHFQRIKLTTGELLKRIDKALSDVGLDTSYRNRYPHEFSGGQQQRIGIARALMLQPDFIVCDEPVSALDVSVQAQILNLLNWLQQQYSLTYLFISHDLSVVKYISRRVAVMYLGRIVEQGPASEVLPAPAHPYTEALMSAAPRPDPHSRRKRIVLEGDVPSPTAIPSGCRFHNRCPYATQICTRIEPALVGIGDGRYVACHHHEYVLANASVRRQTGGSEQRATGKGRV